MYYDPQKPFTKRETVDVTIDFHALVIKDIGTKQHRLCCED